MIAHARPQLADAALASLGREGVAEAPPAEPETPRRKVKVPKKFQGRFEKCNRNMAYIGTDMYCGYCGRDLLADVDALAGATVDHIVPIALGGSSYGTNVVASCYACNHLKADLPARNLEEARRLVDAQREFYSILLRALRAEYREFA